MGTKMYTVVIRTCETHTICSARGVKAFSFDEIAAALTSDWVEHTRAKKLETRRKESNILQRNE